MELNQQFLDELSAQAKANPRLRQNYDMRTSEADTSQRMLNAMEPGTIVPIHRHRSSAETVILIRGRVKERFFDDNGNETLSMELNQSAPLLQIPAGQWHTVEVLESQTIIFEAKDGAYQPLDSADIMQ